MRLPIAVLAFALAAPGLAQTPAQMPDARNLKALPNDIPKEQLLLLMQSYGRALGQKCSHCHVGEGEDYAKYDFASDARPKKQIARQMIVMSQAINDQWLSRVSKTRLTCWTCHRGKEKPETHAPVDPAGAPRG